MKEAIAAQATETTHENPPEPEGETEAAERARARHVYWQLRRRQRRKGAMGFLVQGAVGTLAGAAVGVLLVFPLLPADVADQVIELQRRVSEMFG